MIRNWIKKYKANKREEKVLKNCGCACYCPKCKDILNDQAKCEKIEKDDNLWIYYTCNSCGNKSKWNFDILPLPLCLDTQC